MYLPENKKGNYDASLRWSETMNAGSPFAKVVSLIRMAYEHEASNPSGAVLSTVGDDGVPMGRVILIKKISSEKILFFTNYGSNKAIEIRNNPNVSLTMHYPTLGVQIRINGEATKASDSESDEYWDSRDYNKQVSAMVSHQSKPIKNRGLLISRFLKGIVNNLLHKSVPRPSYWGGYVVRVNRFEIFYYSKRRLHTRLLYTKENGAWTPKYLQP